MGELNLKDALVHLGGSVKLYRTLIQGFKDKYSNIDIDIQDKLLNREIEDARRLAHSMKGLSGNLGASNLQLYAKNLEEVIKSYLNVTMIEDDIDAILGKEWILFSQELRLVNKTIDKVLEVSDEQLIMIESSSELLDLEVKKEDMISEVRIKELKKEEQNSILALARALNTYNYELIMTVLQSQDDKLLNQCCFEKWSKIKNYISNYEYDQAKEVILEGVLDEE